MKSCTSRKNLHLLGTVSALALALPIAQANAQQVQLPTAPINQVIDERGVDIATGQLATSLTPLSIGDASNGLALTLTWAGVNGFRNNHMVSAVDDSGIYAGIAANSGFHFSVTIGAIAHGFTKSGTAYLPDEGDGTSFSISADSKSYTFTDRNGGVMTLSRVNYIE